MTKFNIDNFAENIRRAQQAERENETETQRALREFGEAKEHLKQSIEDATIAPLVSRLAKWLNKLYD